MIITIGGLGKSHTSTGAASAATTMPTLSNGNLPKYIQITGTAMADKLSLFVFGGSAVADPVATTAYPVKTGNSSPAPGPIINVAGCTHFKSLALNGTSNPHIITPLAAVASEGS